MTGLSRPRRRMIGMTVGVMLCATAIMAQPTASPARKSLAELVADVVRATQEYRDAVVRSVPIHEAQVQQAVDALEERRQLHKAGMLSAAYVEQAERDLMNAERDLTEARAAI